MREDYQKLFLQVCAGVASLGGVLIEESDLEAIFSLSNDKFLSFECERYYVPAFNMFLSSKKKPNEKFEIGVLMNVFERIRKDGYGPATIENQFNFLRNTDAISAMEKYRDEYYRSIDLLP